MLLLGFIYAMNEYLIDHEEIGHKIALIGATISMYAIGLVIVGFMYHYYAPFASCGLNIFFITWTLIMGMAYSLYSVSPNLSLSGRSQLHDYSGKQSLPCEHAGF